MNSTRFVLFAAGLVLAMAFTACGDAKATKILTDPRDGKKYKTVKIGEQTWMAENLNFNASGSVCYDNEPANCEKYGRLYNWNVAMSACPSGWHLPNDAEWNALERAVGGSSVAGTHLKAKNGWNQNGYGLDTYGFAALPGGYGYSNGNFGYVGDIGFWWSATEFYAYGAWVRSMDYDFEYVLRDGINKSALLSARCVQD